MLFYDIINIIIWKNVVKGDWIMKKFFDRLNRYGITMFGILLTNIAMVSAMAGRSRFIFYNPEIPESLKKIK